MDFNGIFGAELEESDDNSSDGDRGCYYASDEEGDEDEGDPTGCREDENGNLSGGASHAGDDGKSRPVVAEDFMGREFVGEEDAYLAYKEFARMRGFGVRKGDVGRVDGVLVRRDFFCHRQGTRHAKHYDRPERVREERLESRTDCKAKLKIFYDVQRSVWKVRSIFDEHNHELAPAMFSHLVPSHRSMSDGDKAQVDSMKQFGIPTAKIMAYMAGQSGGYGMLRFTKRDLYNYIHGQRLARISDGDAAATISYLEGKANADMTTVAHYTRTADDRLGSLFWVDGEMMTDYQLFGDVMAFDSTYRSNKYKKPLVVFSGCNGREDSVCCCHGWGQSDARSHRGGVPGSKAPAVWVALGENCVQRVKDTEFRKVFKKAMYANFEVEDFEEYWKTAVESLGLQNNSWVQQTYEVKESWATAYLRGTFCAGYRTTSRCEGINAYIKGFLKSTDSILELVHSLDRVVKVYRNNEVTAQFYSTYYSPVLTTGLDSIELFASKLYTRAVFREVKKQIRGVATLLFRGRDSISTTVVYKFSRMGAPGRIHKVLFDPDDKKIQCDCSMWNSEGIPCSHIFCLMKYEGLEQIPDSLIVRRWCKDAKDSRRMPVTMRPGDEGRMLRYAALSSATSLVATLGSDEREDFEFAKESIASLIDKLRHRVYERAGGQPGMSGWKAMKDPVVARTKGAPKRKKEFDQCSQPDVRGKRRCCTKCGTPGHTKRTCSGYCARGVSGIGNGVSPTDGNGSHDGPAAASASLPTELGHAYEDQTSGHGEAGLNNVSTSAANTSSMVSRRGSPCWRPPFSGGGSGGNFFLGGQHIHQFYASQPCSGHQSDPPPHAGHGSMSTPMRAMNEDLFERWLLQNVMGRRSSSNMQGGFPTRGT
ncbi:protein FAR1-RELATED SEQUENCE 5-like [Arachis stenosperma]|uniref:protein FAR1-RELATED SEQUENCE 5-like n=1 Tax=Arachis stenosperma TaxID=217475 RepID=UPI0025AB8550|nr:protein FAR1-RELATED SEQUENCE 5-like [Arachis stenosperma]